MKRSARFVMSPLVCRVMRATLRAVGGDAAADVLKADCEIQRTAATITTTHDDTISSLRHIRRTFRRALDGDTILELKRNEEEDPQCVDCGCCRELACEGGCSWAESNPWRCSRCNHIAGDGPHTPKGGAA